MTDAALTVGLVVQGDSLFPTLEGTLSVPLYQVNLYKKLRIDKGDECLMLQFLQPLLESFYSTPSPLPFFKLQNKA